MPNKKPMDKCERGVWIDTEGTITSPNALTRTYSIAITQSEREPLEDYCEGARGDGIPCTIRWVLTRHVYQATISGVVNVAKEIMLTKPCIRTKKKHDQIQDYIKAITKPRKYVRHPIKKARQIMGV